MENKDELRALIEETHNSEAIKHLGRLETLRANFYVFNRNYQELKKLLETLKKGETAFHLWDLRNGQQLDIAINEVLRMLQNYLASAKSLVDQTRVIIRGWYTETNFMHEYEKQVDSRFVGNPLAGFIEDLRNFSLHYSLPLANATFSVKTIDQKTKKAAADFSFVLKKSDLLIWKGWKKGKNFLNAIEDEINIETLADEYYKQILDFHSWLINSLQEIHKDDLLWLAEMRQKTINAMSEEERQARGLA
jgi:hypothetical protein